MRTAGQASGGAAGGAPDSAVGRAPGIPSGDAPGIPGGGRALQFLRFCAVGAVGFLVDAGLLMVGLRAGLDPLGGRLLSFAVAVLATFELNRRWAFRAGGDRPVLAALAAYLGVQGLGFACNFGIYTLLYLGLPRPYNLPLLCLVAASALALIVNYAGASLWVFKPRRPHGAVDRG